MRGHAGKRCSQSISRGSPQELDMDGLAAVKQSSRQVLASTLVLNLLATACSPAPRGGHEEVSTIRDDVLSLPQPEWLTIRNSPVMALSPDGSHLVYSAGGSGLLYLRPVDGGPSRLLGTNLEGSAPFFSPDGKWIGFFS